MSRPGYDEGWSDARDGRPPAENGDEEYYISYNREADYWDRIDERSEPMPQQPEPTQEEVCEAMQHPYQGDDEHGGRCYCGARRYAKGGGDT